MMYWLTDVHCFELLRKCLITEAETRQELYSFTLFIKTNYYVKTKSYNN
jgi:hypothetical protein